jgi:membrane-bound serine protease (ClpP class)
MRSPTLVSTAIRRAVRLLPVLGLLALPLHAQGPGGGAVMVARVDSIIQPVVADYLVDTLAEADRVGAAAVVVELNTPGGLMTSTREISQAMLNATTPVVVYVAPSGAQAASAGFFILMSADVAAMAPGSNTGAAHPVGGQGEDIKGTMGEKVEQDAAANIRSLAARRGRNVELAEKAVVESRSFTAEEAKEEGLIDVVAPSLEELLADIDGFEVEKASGEKVALATAEAPVERTDMSPVQRFLSILVHPNVAYILLTLGFLGLYFELSNPGVILPGVVGGICLILGFYGLSVLPVNYAGLALILLAMILFIAEVKVTSFGLLTVAGVISLVVGSLMLFKSTDPAVRVSLSLVYGMAAFALITATFLVTLVVRAHRSQVQTGAEGLVGRRAVARTALEPRGKVFLHGELWDAEAETSVPAGQEVEVAAVDGLRLKVRPLSVPSQHSGGEVA